MASVAVLEKLSQAKDSKQALVKEVGDLSKIALMANRVLIAIYIAPEKTKGGLYRATQSIREDVFQGTVGLVLKKGTTAFAEEADDVKVGDWVVFRPGDGKRIQLNGVDCRLLDDDLIYMVIDDPEIVTHQ